MTPTYKNICTCESVKYVDMLTEYAKQTITLTAGQRMHRIQNYNNYTITINHHIINPSFYR